MCSNCYAQTVESAWCTAWRRAECTRPSDALRCSLQTIANAGCDDPCPQSWRWQGPCHSVADTPSMQTRNPGRITPAASHAESGAAHEEEPPRMHDCLPPRTVIQRSPRFSFCPRA